MDFIPLPDDIPVPEDPPVPTDLTILPQPTIQKEDLVSDAIPNLPDAVPDGQAYNPYVDTADNTVVDMEYQDSASDPAPETCDIVAEIIPPDEGATVDHLAHDTFSESHDMFNSKADVPVPGESEHELLIENSEQTPSEEVKQDESATASTEIPMQVSEQQYDPPLPENTAPAGELTAAAAAAAAPGVVDPALQNNQMQYSAANYMYPQMGDPSMMSHNYPYMTTPSSYNDYMSMYHAANRMPRSYANAYAQYPGYNYAYPHMQQMYDGRNMAAYPAGNYSAQMIPSTTPMLTAGMNSFTPPLPAADYSVPVVFPSSNNSASPVSTSSVNQQQLQVEKSESSDKTAEVESLLPPLPDTSKVEENTANSVDEKKPEDDECPPAPLDAIEKEQNKDTSDDQKTASQENHVSEDVNRYSPSLPMDEDDAANQAESADSGPQIRPPQKVSSVLGKAQAKKRLMAFSFSKQTAAAHIAAKKQAQETASSNHTTSTRNSRKENGEVADVTSHSRVESVEVSGNVFDDKHSKKKQRKTVQKEKARETIEEIEELKRTEMMMSTNALMYRKNLLSEGSNMNQSSDMSKRSGSRRRSRSGSRNRRYSRSRSRERKFSRHDRKYRRRSRSRTRSKSRSLSPSSSVQERKSKIKASDIKSWNDFRESGFRLDKYRRIKFKENTNQFESEVQRRKKEVLIKHRHRRSRSKEDGKSRSRRSHSKEDSKHKSHKSREEERRSVSVEKEVVAEIRKRKVNFLGMPTDIKVPLLVPRGGYDVDDPIEYPSQIMQYTDCKPVIRFCENPKTATDHFINRAQLLETVPEDIAAMLKQFWGSIKPKRLKDKLVDQIASTENGIVDNSKSIRWWSQSPLDEENLPSDEEIEIDNEDVSVFGPLPSENDTGDEKASSKTLEKTARVRKSRFEEADDGNQGISIVVRSRWDSDYEDSLDDTPAVPKKAPKEDQSAYPSPPRNEAATLVDETRKGKLRESSSRKHDSEAKAEPEEDAANKASDSNETRSRKHSDRRKREEADRHHEARKSKSTYESTAESNDVERESKKSSQNATEVVASKGGDLKLVSEYEEFMKILNSETPKDDSATPLYEGPKPPPLWTKKPNEDTATIGELPSTAESKSSSVDRNPFVATEEEKRVEVNEDEFDVDKFFQKEKEKKLKKLSLRNPTEPASSVPKESAIEPANEPTTEPAKEPVTEPATSSWKEVEVEVEVQQPDADSKHDKKLEKKDKKKKKKKVISAKTKKRSTKNKKKRKVDKKKKKKASSDSYSDDSSNESSDSSSKDESSSSSSPSSSSSSSSASSSSSDSDSSSSEPRRKRKKTTKKLKKKERKRTKSSSGDKHKRKKRKQKSKDSDSEDKKNKKKLKNEDGKKSKSKRLSSDNFLELIEKSLASTVKKSEAEESPPSKDAAKEKAKKRKKKHDKSSKKEKKDLLNMMAPDLPEEVRNNLLEEIAESSDGVSKSKEKKRKAKKKKESAGDMSDDEATSSGWRKKIDPRELEENASKVQNAFFEEDPGVAERKTSDKASPNTKKRKKKMKKKREGGADLSADEQPSWKKKKIDPKEIEESVAKAQRDSFFEENLDDWDNSSTGASVVKHSMRDDDSKNEQVADEAKSKKKKKKLKKRKDEKGKTEKRLDKEKHKKDSQHGDKKSRKRAAKDEKFDLEDIPLPDSGKSMASHEKRNFAMFSRDRTDDEGRKSSSQDSPCQLQDTAEEPPVPPSDRYSPTEDADEEETQLSEDSKIPKGVPPPKVAPVRDETYSFSSTTNTTSGLFPFLQNTSTFPSVVPSPVPAPCPVPPPSQYPLPSKEAKPAATSPCKDADPEDEDKSNETSLGCKSFSIAKVEFRTKAALKCFSSNVFDAIDGEENGGAVLASMAAEVEADPNKAVADTGTGDKDIPKEVEEPPAPSFDTSRLSDELAQQEPKPPASPKEADRSVSQKAERHRSASRDRSSKRRNRHDREDSYDNYRRRSRSRDRYKKYYRKDRYKRRSRSRSRSRTRRRSRDREHFRHKRRSFSNERGAAERKRSPSYDRRKSRDLPNNSAEFENNIAATSKPEIEERWGDLKTEEEHRRRISEITKCVRDMETSNPDGHMLKENLFQLKETLQNLNKQGLPMDSLRNVLSVLENIPLTQGGRRTGAGDGEDSYQNIVSVWHSIQNSLPAPPAYEARLDPRTNRSPQDAKKAIKADSTNNNFAKPKKRFDIRSREISPKPLSLDERLELELGVKRTMPTLPAAPGAYYPVGVYENVPNFSAPPPPIPNFPPPMMNCTPPEHGYYGVGQPPPPMTWNNRDPPFVMRPDMAKLPPPMMRPAHQIPPPRMVQQPPEPAPVSKSAPYVVPSDLPGSKVHSIQVGNVLQIVPTELQAGAAVSSQPRVPSSPAPVVVSSVPLPSNLPPVSMTTTAVSAMPPSMRDFSSLLSAHLPSFAAAPAVQGAKLSVGNDPPVVREHRLVPNDPRHKAKDPPPPPPPSSVAPEMDLKKMLRMGKERRKEEKALQSMLKGRASLTPTNDDSSLYDDGNQDGQDEHVSVISIKPSPEQGILVSPGFRDKSTPVTPLGRSIIGSTRKMVSFVDGIRPGSTGVYDSPPAKTRRPSPPPSPVSSAPPRKKHKVRVKLIRPDDSDDDDDAPPPPPPGPPPPELYPPSLGALGVLPPGFILPKL